MENVKIGDTPFSVLMQQAVKLKSHMHKIDRVAFDRWPKFYQNSTFVRDEQREERKLPFAERMAVARSYKEKGSAAFREKDFLQAGLNFEFALGLFKWATPLDPNWRKRSVDDAEIREEVFEGDSEEERREIRAFRATNLLNLARAYYFQREFATARQACDWALAVVDDSETRARGYLLRARCLVAPASHGATERDDAISDLEKAHADGARSSTVAEIRTFLTKLRKEKRLGRAQDKKYAGLFERGEVYDACESQNRQRPFLPGEDQPNLQPNPQQEDSDFVGKVSVDAQLSAMERLMAQYQEEGKKEEVEELRSALASARAKLGAREDKARLNFRAPTDDMKRDAKERGIDLDDPRVVDMLEQLQRQKLDPDRQSKIDAVVRRENLQKLTVNQLLARLNDDNKDQSRCDNKQDLIRLLAESILDEENENDACRHLYSKVDDDDDGSDATTNKKKRRRASWKLTLGITVVLVALRLWTSNLVRPLVDALANGVPIDVALADLAHNNSRRRAEAPPAYVDPGIFDREDDEF